MQVLGVEAEAYMSHPVDKYSSVLVLVPYRENSFLSLGRGVLRPLQHPTVSENCLMPICGLQAERTNSFLCLGILKVAG